MQISNKENANPNLALKKLQALKAETIQKQEQSATTELDQVYRLYSDYLIPRT